MKKIIILIIILVILLFAALFLFQTFFGSKNKVGDAGGPATLTYWGLWEEEKLMQPLIAQFQKQNPKITVNYIRSSSQHFRTRAITQIQGGQGPDVLRIHNSWLPMFEGLLAPAPPDIFSIGEYKSIFYPVAEASFVKNSQIFAAPMEIDGLALYYNEEILAAAGVQVPRNWEQFFDAAVKMTVKDPTTGEIQTSGAAMGEVANIDHWSDILGLLLLQQPGVNFNSLASVPVADVFRFYTKFVNNPAEPQKTTWSRNLQPSTQMFAQGRLAFYFAPSWRAHELRQINSSLKFKIAPVPQLQPEKEAAWASFWGEAVSVKSKYPKEAWQFVKFLTSAEAQKLLYAEASKVRLFGEPYSRQDLKDEILNDPLVGAYVAQGPIYKSWSIASNTFDQGLNDQIIKYFEDAVNKVIAGADPQSVLPTVDVGVKQVLQNINKPPVPAATGTR